LVLLAVGLCLEAARPPAARPGGGYFAARGKDVRQPSQRVFLTWDPQARVETFTVQPRFEGTAPDFALIVPTPSRPKLRPMPRDFFRHLAVFSRLMERTFPRSQLLPPERTSGNVRETSSITELETGVVGALDYKIIAAERAADLYQWLKDHKYHYAGDEATLNFYVQKRWVFTVLKIDATQLRPNRDGSYAGAVTPTRFEFRTDKLVYPLRIARAEARDTVDVLFYVQAPFKVDLAGDLSYQHTWIPLLQSARGRPGGLPGKGSEWLEAVKGQAPALLERGRALGYHFTPGQPPRPNPQGRTPTMLEWARRLSEDDLKVLGGEGPYSEQLADVDDGFAQADLKDPRRAEAVYEVIRRRLAQARKERPLGSLVRHAPGEDLEGLKQLVGHLRPGQFLTKLRKTFTRDELSDDLRLVPARLGNVEDASEYTEELAASPR
jgi:hypothetical protein